MTATSPGRRAPAELPPAGARRVWTIPLPYTSPPITLNTAGGHWARQRKIMANLHEAGFFLARQHKVPALDRITAELVFWPGDNRVHDADNLALTLKGLMDGVRLAGVVPDDRGRHVRSAICTVVERADDPDDNPQPRMALVLREV